MASQPASNVDEAALYRAPAAIEAGRDPLRRLPSAYLKLHALWPAGTAEAVVRQLDTLDDAYSEGTARLVITLERVDGAWRFVRLKPDPPEEAIRRRDR